MLNEEQRKFAIEDANKRREAQLELIKFNDQKAMGLLSLYVTLGTAAVGVALTYFGNDPTVSRSAALGLGAAAICLLIGAMFCFGAIESVEVALPGRGYDFWKIAMLDRQEDAVTFEEASRTYILDGIRDQDHLRTVNRKIASHVQTAKAFGIAAPLAAATVGLIEEMGWFANLVRAACGPL